LEVVTQYAQFALLLLKLSKSEVVEKIIPVANVFNVCR